MQPPIEDLLTKIGQQVRAAEEYLAVIRAEMSEVEAAGMYPAVPSERWKDEKYLYMVFTGLDADKLSLDAKGRIYIGSDPAKVAEARRLAANRQQWERLDRQRKDLESWLWVKENEIGRLAKEAGGWQRLIKAEQLVLSNVEGLGLEIAPASAAPVPKLGTDIRQAAPGHSPNEL